MKALSRDLIIFQKPHPPSHWDLGFNIWIGETGKEHKLPFNNHNHTWYSLYQEKVVIVNTAYESLDNLHTSYFL